jgi:tetratricopeptide (TPR) repeat protein
MAKRTAARSAGPRLALDPAPWAVAAAAFLAFIPALSNGLVWDDAAYVRNNPLFRLPWSAVLPRAFRMEYIGAWTPLTMLSLTLDDRLGGPGPLVFHLVNLLLHAMNAALIFELLRRLVPDRLAAFAAAAFWAVHPLRVESVAWISERKDVLYVLFFLLALHAYLRHVAGDGRKRGAYAAALALFAASTLAKGMAVSLVPVLFLVDWLKGRRLGAASVAEKIPFVAVALGVGAVAVVAQGQAGAIPIDPSLGLPARVIFACYGLLLCLVKTVAPVALSGFYPYPRSPGGGSSPVAWAAVPLVAALLAGSIVAARRSRLVGFGAGFYLATIVLVLQVLPFGGAVAADRFTYLPAVGLSVLLATGLSRLGAEPAHPPRLRRAAITVTLVVVAALGVATWHRCGVWRDDLVFWSDVIAKAPNVLIAHQNRGVALEERGDLAAAAAEYDQSIRIDPTFAESWWARANIRAGRSELREALSDYDEAIRLNPSEPKYRFNQGLALGDAGRWEDAVAALGEAIRLSPKFAEAYLNRGLALEQMGRTAEGFPDVQRARALGYPVDPAVLARFSEAARPGEHPGRAGRS